WDFAPLVPEFLAAMRRLGLDSTCLTSVLTNAVHQPEWRLGLRHHSLLVSPIWSSPGYLLFVHHLLARADAFAAEYNAALGAYRRENGTHSSGRPWPDLMRREFFCEAPFWLDSFATGERLRGGVSQGGGKWVRRVG